MEFTLKMILSLIESRYSSDYDFEKDFGLARSTVSAWRKGKLKSYEKRINEIAHFFNVDISYFYEPKEKSLSPKDKLFGEMLVGLDDEQLKKVKDYIAFVKSNRTDEQ